MNKKILIPVDFSEYSQDAINYAVKLASDSTHDIDLMHVFTDHTNIYSNSLENTDLIDPRVGEAKRSMTSLVEDLATKIPNSKINAIYADGNLYDTVKSQAAEQQYDAIIMGTKGSSGLEALLIGSNMFDVFQNTNTPVLAIPHTGKKIKTDKIGLLCNFKQGEIDVLNQAINIFGKGFELILIHVNTENETIKILDDKFEDFIQLVIKETGIDNISYIIKAQTFLVQYKEDISTAIDSVVADELLDVLLVTKSKKGFLRKIIEENIVKKMAYEIQIPKFFAKSQQA